MIHSLYASHITHLQNHWSAALEAEGYSAVVVHSGSPIVSFMDDYVYPFRPNPHFLAWLPLTRHHDSVLIIRPGSQPQLWYYQPEDYWHMPPEDPEAWWAEQVDVRVVTETDSWKSALKNLGNRVAVLGDAAELKSVFPVTHINPAGLVMRLHLVRTRKTAYELECMRTASRRAAGAHLAARDAFLAGESEYYIHQAYLASVQQSDAELPYHSIVAVNDHAAVLHYQQRLRTAASESRSFLIDAGACCHAYASDITRTYATRSGEFAELVAAMDQVERQLAGQAKAGQSYPALHLGAHQLIAGLLKAAGIIRISPEDAVSSGLSSVFFPHGLGHFIGLQTHDVAGLVDNKGETLERPAGHPWLRLTRVLETGNVLTIEPGLYFIPSLLAAWRANGDRQAINWPVVEKLLPYGGIRIEDNVVVGDAANENLTRNAFASL
ncbi:MAG TPA: Xaa-Pro dipeptidase [Xanthomonadales bacterium]|nr:Xaa-Pro dipeptidase [Xanthomonadales bacterium]